MDTIERRHRDPRQFRRELRGSTEDLIVGIDVAKDRRHAYYGAASAAIN